MVAGVAVIEKYESAKHVVALAEDRIAGMVARSCEQPARVAFVLAAHAWSRRQAFDDAYKPAGRIEVLRTRRIEVRTERMQILGVKMMNHAGFVSAFCLASVGGDKPGRPSSASRRVRDSVTPAEASATLYAVDVAK